MPLPLCSHHWGRGRTPAWWRHPMPPHPSTLSNASLILSLCLFLPTPLRLRSGLFRATHEVEPSQSKCVTVSSLPFTTIALLVISLTCCGILYTSLCTLWLVHCLFLSLLSSCLPHPQDWESLMVRSKDLLDPPYLPPSLVRVASCRLRIIWEEGETHSGVFLSSGFSRPDVRRAASHHRLEKRRLTGGIQVVTMCGPCCVWNIYQSLKLLPSLVSEYFCPRGK